MDVIRRTQAESDPHPLRLSDHEDDLWPVQVPSGEALLSAPRFTRMVVSTAGSMARMHTIAPAAFARIKRSLSQHKDRDPLKRRKDRLQAEIVEALLDGYLPPADAVS